MRRQLFQLVPRVWTQAWAWARAWLPNEARRTRLFVERARASDNVVHCARGQKGMLALRSFISTNSIAIYTGINPVPDFVSIPVKVRTLLSVLESAVIESKDHQIDLGFS